jgi:triacylglycerol esterase/lipase EstA (alpha/beta hydrolase family)
MRAPGAERLAGLSPRRKIFVAAMTIVTTVVVCLFGLAAGGVFASPRHLSASRPGVVLLVPGYGDGTSALRVLAAKIRRTGRRAELVSLPGNATGDLGTQAAVLNTQVNAALAGGAEVDVIGYSAGGVVTRLWDATYNGAAKARFIITLGSPLNGTQIAAAGNAADPGACPVACQELVPGSTLLSQLRKTPYKGKPAWLSLWTNDDQVVRPPTSARLAGAINLPLQSVCPDAIIAHGQLPSAPLVMGIVLSVLRSERVSSFTSSQCASLQKLGG